MRSKACIAAAALVGGLAAASGGARAFPAQPSFEIYSIGVNGKGARNLTRSPLDDDSPTVSPDGRAVVFVRTSADQNRDLWIMNTDGSGQRQLTTSAAEDEFDPVWSPDGTLIAFTTGTRDICPPRPCPRWSVRIVRPDGSGLRELAANVRYTRWSPNGQKLVVETDIDPYQEAESIAVVPLDGAMRTIVETAEVVEHPVWSQDGRIAFTWNRGDADGLYVARADGGGRRRIVKDAGSPEWSPSGRQIAFLRSDRLRVIASRGGRARKLASADGFAWSRHGRRLALFLERGRIAVIAPNGKGFRIVARLSGLIDAYSAGPGSWSRDGRRLFYAARLSSG